MSGSKAAPGAAASNVAVSLAALLIRDGNGAWRPRNRQRNRTNPKPAGILAKLQPGPGCGDALAGEPEARPRHPRQHDATGWGRREERAIQP